MSHFSVMVIGDDIEEQLAPYHEFECTGHDDEYVEDVDITDEAKETFDEDSGETFAQHIKVYYGSKIVPYGTEPDLEGVHKYGYAIANEQGEVTKVIRRTNPNAKWDWWVLGGRWRGFLKLKPDATGQLGSPGVFHRLNGTPDRKGYVDSALKGQIDIQAMRDEAAKEAEEDYDKVHAVTGTSWKPFSFYRETIDSTDDARTAYFEQEALKNLKKSDLNYLWDVDQFLVERDEYVQSAVDSVLSTYAVVKDGKWYAQGEMGWFGMSSDDMTQAEWNKQLQELFKSLPDDTRISIVDCHI